MGSWKRFLIIYFYCYLFNLAVLQKKHLDQYQTHVRRGLSRISPEVITITIMTFDFSSSVMPQWLNLFDTKILLFILNLFFFIFVATQWRSEGKQTSAWWRWSTDGSGGWYWHITLFSFYPVTAKCVERSNSTKNPKFHFVKFWKTSSTMCKYG